MSSEVKIRLSDVARLFQKSTDSITLILNLVAAIVSILTTIQLIESDSQRLVAIGIGIPLLIWVLSFYVYKKKIEVTSNLVRPEKGNLPFTRTERLYSSKIRRAALVSLFFVPLLIIGTLATNVYLRNRPSGKIVILVAEFEPLDQNHGYTECIFEELRRRTKQYSDVEVRKLGTVITPQDGSESARKYGKEYKANIVLWGWHRSLKENAMTWAHVEILQGPKRLHLENDTQELKTPAADVDRFDAQIELAEQMSSLVLQVIGVARVEAHDYSGAISCFNEALAVGKIPTQMMNRSSFYFFRGYARRFLCDVDGAISDYSESIKCGPSSSAYYNRAYLYDEKGDWENAIKDYGLAIQLCPDWACAHNKLAAAYLEIGDLGSAILEGTQAINIAPESYDHFYVRGLAYYRAGKYDEAIRDFNEYIAHIPDAPDAYTLRAAIKTKLGNYDEALADCDNALALDSDIPDAYDTLGVVLAQKGKLKQALNAFNRAIQLQDDFDDSYINRARVYAQMGESDLAISDYQRVLQVSKDEVIRQKAMAELKNLTISASNNPAK